MKQTKEQVIENLKNISYNVMFTKEELINIIENVEENTRFPFNSYLDEITELVVSTLDDMDTDELISEYDIGLNNKEVYLESFHINERKVTTKIKTELSEYFKSIVTGSMSVMPGYQKGYSGSSIPTMNGTHLSGKNICI